MGPVHTRLLSDHGWEMYAHAFKDTRLHCCALFETICFHRCLQLLNSTQYHSSNHSQTHIPHKNKHTHVLCETGVRTGRGPSKHFPYPPSQSIVTASRGPLSHPLKASPRVLGWHFPCPRPRGLFWHAQRAEAPLSIPKVCSLVSGGPTPYPFQSFRRISIGAPTRPPFFFPFLFSSNPFFQSHFISTFFPLSFCEL